jgi:hypothetical protein
VAFLGALLIGIGTLGFHELPGMIEEDATGDFWVNSFYCSVMTLTTIGFGDICPSDKTTITGKAFIVFLAIAGLGMFTGPVMDLTSSWKNQVPGGFVGVIIVTLGLGISIFTTLEGMTEVEALYFTIVAGTTIGYGEIHPNSNLGKLAVSLFALLIVNVAGGFLQPAKEYLSYICSRGTIPLEKSTEEGKKRD